MTHVKGDVTPAVENHFDRDEMGLTDSACKIGSLVSAGIRRTNIEASNLAIIKQ